MLLWLGRVFFIFSDLSILVYRNTIAFCRLTLYLATLLKLLIRFLVESLGLSVYKVISSANNNNCIPSFHICMPFISLPWLIALARSSSTILNKTNKSGCPCLVSQLTEKAFNFLLLSILSSRCVLHGLYYVEICPFYLPTVEDFVTKGCCILSNGFYASTVMIM